MLRLPNLRRTSSVAVQRRSPALRSAERHRRIQYAIRLSGDASGETPVVLVSGHFHTRIAGSFAEFGEKYLAGERWAKPSTG